MSDEQGELAVTNNFITQISLQRIRSTATELIDEGELTDKQRERVAAIQADADKLLRELRPADEEHPPAAQAAQDQHDFLSVVAHELRTPLTSLRGFAQTGLRQIMRDGSISPDRIQHILESIDQQAERLTQLLAQFREISRLEAGRLVLDCKPTELVGLTESLSATIQAPPEKITVHTEGPVTASVDALRLRQVLTYCVEAALQNNIGEQPVSIEVSSPDGLSALITIFDHGGEVLPEQKARLTHLDGQIRGADLDLHISRQIIDLHKGQLYIEFPPEGGTRFTISLPVS